MKVFRIGIVGDFQSGKSTLINCLLGRPIATIGDGTPTTHSIVSYLYGEEERLEYIDISGNICRSSLSDLERLETSKHINQINVFVSSPLLRDFVFADMPGFGNDERDDSLAEISINSIDFAIVLTRNEKSGEEESNLYKDVVQLKQHQIPYYLIMNCTNFSTWSPCNPDNERIANRNRNLFSFYNPLTYPFENRQTPCVNLMWYWFSICPNDDPIIKHYQSFYDYITSKMTLQDIKLKSNFHLITKIFSMDNRAFLELRNYIEEEIKDLKKELCPLGTIQAFAFDRIPNGWLLCDGKSLKINEYPELYQAIGTTFGGDGVKKFALPDLRSKFIRGWDKRIRKFGSDEDDAFQGHEHVCDYDKKLSEEGAHSHYTYYKDHYISYGTNTFSEDTTSHFMDIITPTEWADKRKTNIDWNKEYGHDLYKLGQIHGEQKGGHSHILPDIYVKDPRKSKWGEVRIDTETRPRNIALLFCIKAKV